MDSAISIERRLAAMKIFHDAGNRSYWELLNDRMSVFAQERGLCYVRDDDSFMQSFDAPPTIVNFFYHEEIKKSAKKGK